MRVQGADFTDHLNGAIRECWLPATIAALASKSVQGKLVQTPYQKTASKDVLRHLYRWNQVVESGIYRINI